MKPRTPTRLNGMVKESIAAKSAITCHLTLPYCGSNARVQAVSGGFINLRGERVFSLRLGQPQGMVCTWSRPHGRRPAHGNGHDLMSR